MGYASHWIGLINTANLAFPDLSDFDFCMTCEATELHIYLF